MIGKGKSISHTGASMSYGWNQEKEAEVVFSQHIAGEDPIQVTNEFRMVQDQNHRCHNNTLSFVLSPTPEEGSRLTAKQLNDLTEAFVKEMKLKEHQAIAFVHRDKSHTHIHLYVNRIGFNGRAYNDSFIGKRSQEAAERVARDMGLTTAREVQMQKLGQSKEIRNEIRAIHEQIIKQQRPKSLEVYITLLEKEKIRLNLTINKANKLQGFRFEYKGHNFKASEVHRSMSGGRIMAQIQNNKIQFRRRELPQKTTSIAGKTIEMSTHLITSMAKNAIKKTIKRAIETGIGN